jgi:hypothetical protein
MVDWAKEADALARWMLSMVMVHSFVLLRIITPELWPCDIAACAFDVAMLWMLAAWMEGEERGALNFASALVCTFWTSHCQ